MEKEKHLEQVRCIAFPALDEGYKWCAVALEMDIWGFGNTAKDAMQDLDELVDIQIEFAAGKNKLSLLNHPTDEIWFKLWEVIQKAEEQSGKITMQSKQSLCLDSSAFIDKARCYYHKAA